MEKVSVIVPVYNAANTIKRCVNSILSQTYTNLELLLIDDGSEDTSGCICDEYAQKDARVCVFHKENGGVSSARNLGLDKATGKWVVFVDADDYIIESYLFELCASFVDVGLVITGVKYMISGSVDLPPSVTIEIRKSQAFVDELLCHTYFSTPWAKRFHNSIIQSNGLRYNTTLYLGEDTDFVLRYLQFVEDICCLSKPLYIYDDNISVSYKHYFDACDFSAHSLAIRYSLSLIQRKFDYAFPKVANLFLIFHSRLFYTYLTNIRSYSVFQKQVRLLKARKQEYIADSKKKEFMKYLLYNIPFLAYLLLRFCK